ncbi:hypothetical protein GH865_07730 [Rhodocyclus tenuis]|uniref:hypothetical protein n=1 Tax=Rhodocyclus gracilis TaxID=2929842 RepID=UPI001298DE80|nr:hypothetical protein [Rhodocyclus gracilis]MRD73136.1 hypothetical protein [Rhodocyclus gracilis]
MLQTQSAVQGLPEAEEEGGDCVVLSDSALAYGATERVFAVWYLFVYVLSLRRGLNGATRTGKEALLK